MHDCLVKTKLLPNILTNSRNCTTPGIPLASGVMGPVAKNAHTALPSKAYPGSSNPGSSNPGSSSPADSNWPAVPCLTAIKSPAQTSYSGKIKWSWPTSAIQPDNANRNTYSGGQLTTMWCSSINPGWSDYAKNLKPTYSETTHPQSLSMAITYPSKNTSDNRVTYILIATLVLVALDLVFIR